MKERLGQVSPCELECDSTGPPRIDNHSMSPPKYPTSPTRLRTMTNLMETYLPFPNEPAAPQKTHHKTLPSSLFRTRMIFSLPIKESTIYEEYPEIDLTLFSTDTAPDPPIAPRSIVCNTLTKPPMTTISGATNQHPNLGFIYHDPQSPLTDSLDLQPKRSLSPILNFQPQSEFVNSPLPMGSLNSGSRSTSLKTLFQRSEIPVLDPLRPPSQRQPQSEPDPFVPLGGGATPPVGHLYTQIKEHAGFMVGLSGVLGGVALNAVCSDKTKGHPRICYTLSALRIYSILLNLGAITTLAILLLFIPQKGGNTLSSRYLWLLWVGLIVLSSIITFAQIFLFSWPEGVQVGVLVLVTVVCVVAGLIFYLECDASRTPAPTDVEQAN